MWGIFFDKFTNLRLLWAHYGVRAPGLSHPASFLVNPRPPFFFIFVCPQNNLLFLFRSTHEPVNSLTKASWMRIFLNRQSGNKAKFQFLGKHNQQKNMKSCWEEARPKSSKLPRSKGNTMAPHRNPEALVCLGVGASLSTSHLKPPHWLSSDCVSQILMKLSVIQRCFSCHLKLKMSVHMKE